MCILVILKDVVSGWPLVLGSNRDEARDRPWEGPRVGDGVMFPRDLVAGGTWIAAGENGLVIAVTNRPDREPDPARPSRGILALALSQTGSVESALDLLERETKRKRRNAFQMLVGDAGELHVAVHPDPAGVRVAPVPSGLHTLTNRRALDELDAGEALRALDVAAGATLEPTLEELMRGLSAHADRGPKGPDEICKHGDGHGTLSSTIVAVPVDRAAEPLVLFAPGPPCTNSYDRAPWN